MASPSADDMSRMSAPSPRGPPASFTPTPGDVQHMSSCSAAADPGNPNERRRIYRVRSASDIDWNYHLSEKLEPNFKGGPRESTSFDDLCMFCRQIPKMDNQGFNQIHPKDNITCVVQKTMGRHYIHMREVAAWVLNGTHWFSLLKQPMMIVIWCRDWSDASKLQYLMQTFVEQEDKIDKLVQHWAEPTTVNRSLASWQRRISMI